MVRCHAIDNDSGGSHPCHATGGVCEAARGRERQKHEELFLETLSRVTFLWLLHLRLWDCKRCRLLQGVTVTNMKTKVTL